MEFCCLGGVHGITRITGELSIKYKKRIFEKYNVKTNCISWKLLQIGGTFSIVTFAWIFFRADTIEDALCIIKRIFLKPTPWVLFNDGVYSLGLDRTEVNILIISLFVLIMVDYIKYRKRMSIDVFLAEQNLWFKWLIIIGMIVMVLVYGEYGSTVERQQFIYFQF